jgi:hypothetical protein
MSIGIDTVAIPTRNRRAAHGVAAAFAPARTLICDASDVTGRRALVDKLVARGCDRDVVEFALLDTLAIGSTPGANRNFLQLTTLGCRVATVDDDVGPRLLRPAAGHETRIAMDRDPSEFWFLRTGADADALVVPDADLLSVLERGLHLGGPRGSLPIAASWLGLAGDPGSPNGLYWLVQRGASRQRLGLDDASYRAARASGRIMRSVTAPTICSGHGWTPAVVAYDHRLLLPPFLPVLRGQGLAWGATIYAGNAWALCRMPGALEHRLERPRPVDPRLQRAATLGMAVATIVQLALTTARLSGRRDPRTALVALGDRLADLCATEARFAQWLDDTIEARTRGLVSALRDALARHERTPAAWAIDVDRTLDALARVRSEPELFPYDLADRPLPQARGLLREIVRRFARLLAHWPDIVDAAAD